MNVFITGYLLASTIDALIDDQLRNNNMTPAVSFSAIYPTREVAFERLQAAMQGSLQEEHDDCADPGELPFDFVITWQRNDGAGTLLAFDPDGALLARGEVVETEVLD